MLPELKEIAKIIVGLLGYGLLAPTLGFFTRHLRWGQCLCFAGMVLALALPTEHATLTAFSDSFYTGHTRGFEFSIMEFFAIALIASGWMSGEKKAVKLALPGLWIYGLYCLAGALTLVLLLPVDWPRSLIDLENGGDWIRGKHLWAAVFKFIKWPLVAIATHSFIRGKRDILFYAKVASIALMFVALWAMKSRYLGGEHRVKATFDHANSLGMWAYLTCLPLLAIAFHPKVNWGTSLICFFGYASGAVCVMLTVSRASYAVLGVASALIALIGVCRHFSFKSFGALFLFLIGGGFLFLQSMDTIMERVRSTSDVQDPASDLRRVLIKQSQAMLSDSIIGVGWNNYPIACSRPVERYSRFNEDYLNRDGRVYSEDTFYRNPTVECLYWYLLAETGYLGFLTFAVFMIGVFWLTVRNIWRMRDSWVSDFLIALAIALAFLYVHSYLEKNLLQTKNAVAWLILYGMVAKLETERRRVDKERSVRA